MVRLVLSCIIMEKGSIKREISLRDVNIIIVLIASYQSMVI